AGAQRRIVSTSAGPANGAIRSSSAATARVTRLSQNTAHGSCGSRRSWRRCTNCAARTSCAGVRPSAVTQTCSRNLRTAKPLGRDSPGAALAESAGAAAGFPTRFDRRPPAAFQRFRGRRALGRLHEKFGNVDSQRLGEAIENVDGRVLLLPLQTADVGAV